MSIGLAIVLALGIGIVAGFVLGWYVFKKRNID
jgi:uncharacterized protein YneF (UPF0154 family)